MSMAIMRFSMQKSARRYEKNAQIVIPVYITTQVLEDYRQVMAERVSII